MYRLVRWFESPIHSTGRRHVDINWAYKNSQNSEAIAYAEQRHRIQLDVAYSPVSPVTQQLSDQATLGHQQDNEDQGTPSSIETNDTVQQDHVEIVSINSTPDEDRSHEIISINSTQSNRSILLMITVSRTTSLELSIYHSVV